MALRCGWRWVIAFTSSFWLISFNCLAVVSLARHMLIHLSRVSLPSASSFLRMLLSRMPRTILSRIRLSLSSGSLLYTGLRKSEQRLQRIQGWVQGYRGTEGTEVKRNRGYRGTEEQRDSGYRRTEGTEVQRNSGYRGKVGAEE